MRVVEIDFQGHLKILKKITYAVIYRMFHLKKVNLSYTVLEHSVYAQINLIEIKTIRNVVFVNFSTNCIIKSNL